MRFNFAATPFTTENWLPRQEAWRLLPHGEGIVYTAAKTVVGCEFSRVSLRRSQPYERGCGAASGFPSRKIEVHMSGARGKVVRGGSESQNLRHFSAMNVSRWRWNSFHTDTTIRLKISHWKKAFVAEEIGGCRGCKCSRENAPLVRRWIQSTPRVSWPPNHRMSICTVARAHTKQFFACWVAPCASRYRPECWMTRSLGCRAVESRKVLSSDVQLSLTSPKPLDRALLQLKVHEESGYGALYTLVSTVAWPFLCGR